MGGAPAARRRGQPLKKHKSFSGSHRGWHALPTVSAARNLQVRYAEFPMGPGHRSFFYKFTYALLVFFLPNAPAVRPGVASSRASGGSRGRIFGFSRKRRTALYEGTDGKIALIAFQRV